MDAARAVPPFHHVRAPRIDPACAHPRHPRGRRRELVRRPVPRDLPGCRARSRTTLGSSDTTAYLTAVASALLLFASIVVHELGHALAARRHGIEVAGITISPLGGFALMSRESRTPREELEVAARRAARDARRRSPPACSSALPLVGPHRFVDAALLRDGAHVTPVTLTLGFLVTMNADRPALQPDPRLPARRRADRARARVARDRRPQPRHARRRAARPGVLDRADRRRAVDDVGLGELVGIWFVLRRADDRRRLARAARADGADRAARGRARRRHHGRRPGERPRGAAGRSGRSTSSSCATAGRGSPSWTRPGASSACCARRARGARSSAATDAPTDPACSCAS